MHNSRTAFLLEQEPRCILCSYEPPAREGQEPGTTEYKSYDPDIKVGDYVIVPTDTRHNMTVIKVEKVDVEPNLESNKEMHWIIGRVDKSAYEAGVKKEREFLDKVAAAKKAKRKAELKETMLADFDTKGISLIEHTSE